MNTVYTRPLNRIRNWFKSVSLGINTLNLDSDNHPDVDLIRLSYIDMGYEYLNQIRRYALNRFTYLE